VSLNPRNWDPSRLKVTDSRLSESEKSLAEPLHNGRHSRSARTSHDMTGCRTDLESYDVSETHSYHFIDADGEEVPSALKMGESLSGKSSVTSDPQAPSQALQVYHSPHGSSSSTDKTKLVTPSPGAGLGLVKGKEEEGGGVELFMGHAKMCFMGALLGHEGAVWGLADAGNSLIGLYLSLSLLSSPLLLPLPLPL
jgi:hypothetical protein